MTLFTRILVLAVLLMAATAARAAPGPPGDTPRAAAAGARAQSDGLQPDRARDTRPKSAADAAREARREYGGKVLSVTREGNGRQAYYRVKLLDNGHVRVVRIAAD